MEYRHRENIIYRSNGEKLDRDDIKSIEEQTVVDDKQREKKSPELQAALEKIDFNCISDILLDIAERCGVDPGSIELPKPDHIINGDGITDEKQKDRIGGHDQRNIISLEMSKIIASVKSSGVDVDFCILDTIS